MAFPYESLVASGGQVFAYLHEEPVRGVERGLYWGVRMDFEPLNYSGDVVRCSMACEWIPWQARSWRGLGERSLSCDYGDDGIEPTFYSGVNDVGDSFRLLLAPREDAHFDVTMSMLVNFTGWSSEDRNAAMPVVASAVIPFEGVLLAPADFDPAPAGEAEVRALASEFMDLDDFRMMEGADGTVIFGPEFD